MELDRLSVLIDGLRPSVRLFLNRPNVAESEHDALCGVSVPQLSLNLILSIAPLQNALPEPNVCQLVVCGGLKQSRALKQTDARAAVAQPNVLITRFDVNFEGPIGGPIGGLIAAQLAKPLSINLNEASSCLSNAVQLIAQELKVQRCGQSAMLRRSGDVLLICLLRHLIANPPHATGLFQGLADCRVAKTLVAMHTNPSAQWTLESLAIEAGMSRTAFATHFSSVMNISAGKYLEQLRIAIANHLVAKGAGLKQAAKESGYASTSTLCRALSRCSQ